MANIIAPILNIVSVLCSCSANNGCCYLLDLQENKEDLNNALVELKATRTDVKRRVDEVENNPNELMKRTQEVDSWLQRVQTIDDEVVQVIQKVDQEIQGRCFGGNCPINCWNARKVGKLVLRNLPIVNDLKSRGGLFVDVAYRLPPPLVQREPVDLTVGMESMFDKVWRLLAEDEVKVMGLYGFGGVGKTTLLKQINNEFLETTTTSSTNNNSLHGFDVVILVVVSRALNIDAIQMEIGKRLGLSSPDRTSIFNALTKKNFVLLLDDIWEGVDLQSIGIPRPFENKKSKVVFTTRSETVCGHMDAHIRFKVECLPWDKAWTLFQEKVGNATLNSHPDVPELAKMVARECDGLPLALITMGRAMSTKKTVQEWNHAITTLRRAASEFPGMGEPVFPMGKAVFPLLKLSYDNIGNDTIKSCFLYCALFPEDHSVDKAQLVDYWIGEGFISLNEFDHIDEARNYGYDIIGDLKGACLLESGGDEETQVKMHDTIRDMALWITRECGSSKRDKLLTINAFDGTSDRLWCNAERIYLMPFNWRDEKEVPTLESPNLLTLIHHTLGYTDRFTVRFTTFLPQNFFEYMPNLRVLDLTNSGMKTFPTSITGLLELRYLSLSYTFICKLPVELGKLVKLNYLNLSYMMHLQRIQSGVIGSLLDLRVLNLYGSYVVDWELDEVYKLKHLNDLQMIIRTQHNLNTLLNYKNLPRGTTQLILRSETLRLLQFPAEANMVMGIEQQQHLGRSCFQNLRDMVIVICNRFKDLTWVGYLPNLKTLRVEYCEELEEIVVVVVVVDDFGCGSTGGGGDEIGISLKKRVDIFKSLETLQLRELPKLKSICSRNALAFPCLKYLVLKECPELKPLQFPEANMGIEQQQQHLDDSCFQNLIHIQIERCNRFKDLTWVGYLPNLKTLHVANCEELEEIVVDDDFGGGGSTGGGGDEISLKKRVDIFKSLETLEMFCLPKLKSICRNASAFPCLKYLVVRKCPELFYYHFKKKKCPELKPPRQLQFPEANMGIEQQQHLGLSCFQNLREIEILNCNGLKELTWVGYVGNLKTLDVGDCEELEEIVVVDDYFGGGGSTEGGGGGEPILTRKVIDIFKSLKSLKLWDLPKLKSICRRNALAFPCLETLKVYRCPELKKLPFDSSWSNVNNTSLRITGGPNWWSGLQWEEEEEDHDIINNSNELLQFTFLPY